MDKDRIYVMGVGFDPLTSKKAEKEIGHCLTTEKGKPIFVVTPNPVMLMEARENDDFRKILNSADFVLCDGTGVIGAAKRQGTPLPERIAGIDVGENVIKEAASAGKSVYIFGGKPGRALDACEKLSQKYPGLRIAGASDGYTDAKDNDLLVKKICESGANLLIVCLGTPKQEKWIFDNIDRLTGVDVIMALGGAVDVWSGNARRAPMFIIKIRLEWLWRMIIAPSKLKLLPKLIKFRILTRKCPKNADKY